MPFMSHMVGDFLKEANQRVEMMDSMEIAYFGKALVNLRRLIQANPHLVTFESSFRQ